jgi:hypothetical protein
MRRLLAAAVATLAAAAAALVLSGCLATTDEAATWREDAAVAAGDAHSQLRTVRLVLTERDGLIGRYDVSVVWDAEEAVGTASEDLSKTQPPERLRPAYDRLGTLLDEAGSLVSEARTAVGERDPAAYDDLVRRIDGLAPKLEAMEKELGG